MRAHPLPLLAFAAVAVTACSDSTDPTRPTPVITPPPALQPGLWDLKAVDGRTLPSRVAERAVGSEIEAVVLDSGRILINADGTYEQRIWTRTERDGKPHGAHARQDTGRWAVDADRYRLTSTSGTRSFTARAPSPTELRVNEPILSDTPVVGLVAATYVPYVRPSQPSAPRVTGRWSGRDLAGSTLPAAVAQYVNEPGVPGVTEYRLDAAELVLTDDNRYTRTVWYSEWNTRTPEDESSWRVRIRFQDRDFGTYVRSGDSIVLTSGWYQNLVIRGTISPATGRIRLNHGLTAGDAILNVGYDRTP